MALHRFEGVHGRAVLGLVAQYWKLRLQQFYPLAIGVSLTFSTAMSYGSWSP